VDTVYLLPITALGSANRKGDLGSPYGIRNPMALDDRLADPLVPQLTVEEQFAAFCEAAHRMGLKVVLEFVFRTAAQDADWAKEHPDWFYWIRADAQDRSSANPAGYGNPPFTPEEMIPFLGATLAIRRRFADLCSRTGAKDYRVPDGLPANVLGYELLEGKKARLAVLYKAAKDEHAQVAQSRASRDLLSCASFQGAVDLGPQELRILEFLDER
jgi:hypothetical protein